MKMISVRQVLGDPDADRIKCFSASAAWLCRGRANKRKTDPGGRAPKRSSPGRSVFMDNLREL